MSAIGGAALTAHQPSPKLTSIIPENCTVKAAHPRSLLKTCSTHPLMC